MYRKDRTLNGGGVMLLVHKDIPHMPLTELDNDSESVWVKLFVNKKTHFVHYCSVTVYYLTRIFLRSLYTGLNSD